MDPNSNHVPGLSYLGKMAAYQNNPTPVGGMDLIARPALEALKRLKNGHESVQTIQLNNYLNFDSYLDEVWIRRIQEKAKNLRPDVVEKLSVTLNTFLTSSEEAKDELALLPFKIVQESNINLFEIFEKVLNDQARLFEKFKLKIKDTINSSIKNDLNKELGKWAEEIEKKRVSIFFKPCNTFYLSLLTDLDIKKEKEICAVKSGYFYPIKEIELQINSNNFYLRFYQNTSKQFWEEDIKKLMKSSENLEAEKLSLKKEQAQELSNINQRYETLKEEQGKLQKPQKKIDEAFKKQILSLSNHSLDEISKLMQAFALKQINKKKICTIM